MSSTIYKKAIFSSVLIVISILLFFYFALENAGLALKFSELERKEKLYSDKVYDLIYNSDILNLENIEKKFLELKSLQAASITEYSNERIKAYAELEFAVKEQQIKQIKEKAYNLFNVCARELNVILEKDINFFQKNYYNIFKVAVFTLVIALIVIFVPALNMKQVLEKMRNIILKLIEGETKLNLPYLKEKNEIGELARAIQSFKEKFICNMTENNIINEFKSNLMQPIPELNKLKDNFAVKVNNINENIDRAKILLKNNLKLASATNSSIETIVPTVEKLNLVIENLLNEANFISDFAINNQDRAKETQKLMQDLNSFTTHNMKIIGNFNEIFAQIKLLVLSATVESSKDNESDFGFKRVLEEVKNLALKANNISSNANKKIKEIEASISAIANKIKVDNKDDNISIKISTLLEEQKMNSREISMNVNKSLTELLNLMSGINESIEIMQLLNKDSKKLIKIKDQLSENLELFKFEDEAIK